MSDALAADDEHAGPSCLCGLRAACLAVAQSPPDLLTATSMVLPLTGQPGEVRVLRALSEELAERHGLEAACRVDDTSFAVRFSHRAAVAAAASPHPGRVAGLVAALGARWRWTP